MYRAAFRIPLPDGRVLDLGPRTLVMGVINVTPDSFSDGGERLDPDVAVADALRMVDAGADLLDIGGETTRPRSQPLSADEELRRVTPVLERLAGRVRVPVSIDTYKATVAERALDLGATIVNDISALQFDPALAGLVARRRAAVVLMHTRGRPEDMHTRTQYADVVAEVGRELGERVRAAESAGIAADAIIVDPGIGFAKDASQSFSLVTGVPSIAALGRPVLVGPSRKSFLTLALGEVPPSERVWGTAAAVTAAVLGGAHIIRVHDVREMVQVVRVADELRRH